MVITHEEITAYNVYVLTTATKRVAAMTKRIRIVQGGTSASKTISIQKLTTD